MKRNLICIVCPRGCSLTADHIGDKIMVTGHSCPRGEEYAVKECLHPMRTVTATVRIVNRENTMASVKTVAPVPKENMMDVMALLRKTEVSAPVKIGDVVLRDVFGSDIVITKNIL